jgi:hypothetical protein
VSAQRQQKDKADFQLILYSFKVVGIVFKDLQKLVSAQQRENTRKELFQRLQNKPFGDTKSEIINLKGREAH